MRHRKPHCKAFGTRHFALTRVGRHVFVIGRVPPEDKLPKAAAVVYRPDMSPLYRATPDDHLPKSSDGNSPINKLRLLWRDGRTVLGAICTISYPDSTGHGGLDWALIDMEH